MSELKCLRMAAIHTPTPMSTAMGLVAAIVIGQVAIDVGLFTPEVVLYVAVSCHFHICNPILRIKHYDESIQDLYFVVDRTSWSTGIFLVASQSFSTIYVH